MLAWLSRLNASIFRRIDRPPALTRPSRKSPTSCAGVPRNADFAITVPSTTGRSLFAPSPLLSMPVVALNRRADANCISVPAIMLYGRCAAVDAGAAWCFGLVTAQTGPLRPARRRSDSGGRLLSVLVGPHLRAIPIVRGLDVVVYVHARFPACVSCASGGRFRGTKASRVPDVLQRGTSSRVVGRSHAIDLRRRTPDGPCRSEPGALGLPLQEPRPAPGRRLTANSRPTGVASLHDHARVAKDDSPD